MNVNKKDDLAAGGEGYTKPTITREQAIEVLREQFSDTEKFLGLLPDEVRGQVVHGLRLYKSHREDLIEQITKVTDVYSKQELEAKDLVELEKIAKVARVNVDFSAYGAGRQVYEPPEAEILLPAGVVVNKDKK